MEELGRFLVSDGGLLLLVAGESFAYEAKCVVDWKKLVFTERTKRRDSYFASLVSTIVNFKRTPLLNVYIAKCSRIFNFSKDI